MESLTFTTDISFWVYLLAGASLVCMIWACWIYTGRARRVARCVHTHTAEARIHDIDAINTDSPGERPVHGCKLPVSIVVRACDDAENLASLLPMLLAQRYAPGFEIIVVNEGASHATEEVVDSLRAGRANLYLTFTPERALHLSSKKLAITLGVKAAHNPIIVLLSGNAVVESTHWLERMTRHFDRSNVELVLGYSGYNPENDTAPWRRTRAFNHVETAVEWLSAAMAGNAFRGDDANMAFTTDLFFKNKGFSRSLNLKDGVDDIFVSQVTTPDNTAVELSRESMVNRAYFNTRRALRHNRSTHAFTSQRVPGFTGRVIRPGSTSLFWATILGLGASALALPNLLVATVMVPLLLIMYLVCSLSWRAAMSALRSRKLLLTLPWLMLTRPVRTGIHHLRAMRSRESNYTYN